mgnify:CR=1 FL=1
MTMPMNTQNAYLLKGKSSTEKSLTHTIQCAMFTIPCFYDKIQTDYYSRMFDEEWV